MSVLETVRSKVKELTDPHGPASGMLHTAKRAVAHGLDSTGKFVDEKTNKKYSSQINTGVHKAREFLGEEKKDTEKEQAQGEEKQGQEKAQGSAPEPPASGDEPPQPQA